MKRPHYFAAVALASTLAHATAGGSIITPTPTDPNAGGIGYRWYVELGSTDSASFVRHVGAWSWEDQSLFNAANGEAPVGWTHTSEWVALTLTSPAMVTLRLENAAGVQNGAVEAPANLKPGLTIYSGWDNDLAPQAFVDANNEGAPTNDWHTYNNRGNIAWAEDVQYFTRVEPNGTTSIEATILMPAGQYSIVLGGNSTEAVNEPRQGYTATLTTSAVPEPATGGLLVLGCVALLGRCRRR